MPMGIEETSPTTQQSWALDVFDYFFNYKNDIFCIFYQVNLTGGRLFKYEWRRNGLKRYRFKEIGTLYLLKKQKISFFISENIKDTASAQL